MCVRLSRKNKGTETNGEDTTTEGLDIEGGHI